MDNQDKAAWCEAGEKAEGDFVAQNQIDGWGISWNPAKHKDKYAHDLLGVIPMDLKTMKTPFRKAETLYGIPANRAVTINEKDFIRYSENHPNILILCDVQYIGAQYILTVDRARRLLKSGKARRHEYKDRVDDEDGNAKCSYVFDVDDLDKLTGS